MKPKLRTKFARWLHKNGLSYDRFGKEINVSSMAVYYWAKGDRSPRGWLATRIAEVYPECPIGETTQRRK